MLSNNLVCRPSSVSWPMFQIKEIKKPPWRTHQQEGLYFRVLLRTKPLFHGVPQGRRYYFAMRGRWWLRLCRRRGFHVWFGVAAVPRSCLFPEHSFGGFGGWTSSHHCVFQGLFCNRKENTCSFPLECAAGLRTKSWSKRLWSHRDSRCWVRCHAMQRDADTKSFEYIRSKF